MPLGDDIKVGYYVRVLYGPSNIEIGVQRNGTLKIDQEVVDVTSKTDQWWKDHLTGFRTWSLDCDGLLFPADPGQAALVTALLYAGDIPTAPVSIGFYVGSGLVATGTATIKSIEIGGPYQEAGTFKASFEGSGALTNPLSVLVWGTEADNNAIQITGPDNTFMILATDMNAHDGALLSAGSFITQAKFPFAPVPGFTAVVAYNYINNLDTTYTATEIINALNNDTGLRSVGITAASYGTSNGTGLAVGIDGAANIIAAIENYESYRVWIN